MIDFYKLEKERLECLIKYEILDIPSDANDKISKLESIICQTEISLIYLIYEKRQLFKSNNCMNIPEWERIMSLSFNTIIWYLWNI